MRFEHQSSTSLVIIIDLTQELHEDTQAKASTCTLDVKLWGCCRIVMRDGTIGN